MAWERTAPDSSSASGQSGSDAHKRPLVIVRKSRGWSSLGLHDIWEYRELLVFLVWREIQGAYRQTALGMTWIFLRPVLNMLILTVVFGKIVKVPSDGVPYPIFSLAALLPWGFFSNAVTRGARSLVDNMHVISKVYFPRMIIPVAVTVSGIVDFAASLAVVLTALLYYRMPWRPQILWLPLFLLIAITFALAAGLWLATLSVKYRDVSFAITFLLQALMYASPVIYPVSMVPERLLALYNLNPMVVVIQGFRWALLGGTAPSPLYCSITCLVVLVTLVSGAYLFRRTERTVADIL